MKEPSCNCLWPHLTPPSFLLICLLWQDTGGAHSQMHYWKESAAKIRNSRACLQHLKIEAASTMDTRDVAKSHSWHFLSLWLWFGCEGGRRGPTSSWLNVSRSVRDNSRGRRDGLFCHFVWTLGGNKLRAASSALSAIFCQDFLPSKWHLRDSLWSDFLAYLMM